MWAYCDGNVTGTTGTSSCGPSMNIFIILTNNLMYK